jgi:molybdopterin synthase sulfur carrier subunit
VKVALASPLRRLTGGIAALEIEAGTVADALARVCEAHPDLRPRLFGEAGPRQDLRVFVNKKDVRALDGFATALADGDEVSLVPLVAGA